MKRWALVFLAFSISNFSDASDISILEQVEAVDDERVAAMIVGDAARLNTVLSERLRYAHSEKLIESKAEHVERLVTRRLIYRSVDYQTRNFEEVAPGVVVSRGRALMKVGTEKMIFLVAIHFLGVWRQEEAQWRLFAWQSSRIEDIKPLGPASEIFPDSVQE